MTTEMTNPLAAESPETPPPSDARWFDPMPGDWTAWLAFRARATETHHRRESLRNWMMNHLQDGDHRQLGLGYYATGETEQALPHLQAGTDDLSRLLYGNALAELRRPREAIDVFRGLAGSAAVGHQARVALVDRLYDRRDVDGLEQVRGLLQGEAEVAFADGLAAQIAGDRDTAVDALQRAIEADSEFVEATFRLASLLELFGADEDALPLYDRFLQGALPPHTGALMNLGLLHMDREDPAWAATCFRLVADAEPRNDRARRFLRDAEASMGQYYDETRERKADKQNAVLRTPVTDFELSVRARNCLQRMNLHTLGDLVRRTESELLSFKNFGETSLQEVKDILAMKGLRLGMAPSMLENVGAPVEPGQPAATTSSGDGDPLDVNISDLDLSVRSRAALATLGITKVRDLTKTTETTLLSCKNFGQTSLEEVLSKLRNMGLELAG